MVLILSPAMLQRYNRLRVCTAISRMAPPQIRCIPGVQGLRRAWSEDPVALMQTKGTPEVHERPRRIN